MAFFSKKQPGETSVKTDKSYRGYLLKHESRIGAFGGGQAKRKYWFAVSEDSPFLYWYKTKNDVSPAGKISLSGAAFTFDPRLNGVFEIHCGKDVYTLEASNNQFRMDWLNRLQDTRKRAYSVSTLNGEAKPKPVEKKPSTGLLIDISDSENGATATIPEETESENDSAQNFNSSPELAQSEDQVNETPALRNSVPSKFYLTRSGELNEKSFQIPEEPDLGIPGAPVLGSKISGPDDTRESGIDWDRTIRFRVKEMDKQREDGMHEENGAIFGQSCAKTSRFGDCDWVGRNARSKSMVVSDESTRGQSSLASGLFSTSPDKKKFFPTILALKIPVLKTKQKSNCDGCKEFLSVVESLKERCCDTEDEISAHKDVIQSLRLSLSSAKNQIEALKEISAIKEIPGRITFILERENHLTHLQVETTEQKRTIQELAEKNRDLEDDYLRAQEDLEAYKDSLRSKEALIIKLVENSDKEPPHPPSNDNLLDLGVDVALSVGGGGTEGGSVGSGGRLSFLSTPETEVKDISEMGDLQVSLKAYEQQNAFLNKEILDLQAMIRGLENREKDLIRKNFDLEAMFYQLKSKYLLLLNHFKPSKAGLSETDIENLIDDATRWSGLAASNPAILDDEEEAEERRRSKRDPAEITDKLGFFLAAERGGSPWGDDLKDGGGGRRAANDLLTIAAQYNKKSDEILLQKNQESSEEHIAWLTKWDSFLVNLTNQRFLIPSPELKDLIRTGIPHTYRGRVWKSLVHYRVKDTVAELGNGYYESLLKKSLARRETSFDSALKQIDLDLARTLPGNKFFTDPDSGKMDQLRRVLYAYRWHNTAVGYCQGLNRLAAVALLYLEESDAFWFLISCVEHLQPEHYYTSTLLTALADQRVLTDLVNEKLPKIAAVLRQYETDLTMFTLSWFLTCFVDSLTHKVYFQIFDVFLYEGNKVLFRFALAALKMCESQIISCTTAGSLHSCISRFGEHVTDYKKLSNIAFNELNPFPMKHIESRRHFHLNQLNAELSK